ncbi:MAG: F0F1 ATP synthase subunit delta [Pseudomonadota bacterium]
MIQSSAIAKPYARAAFETALQQQALEAWQMLLNQACFVVQDKQVDRLIHNPCIETEALNTFLFAVLGEDLNDSFKNFLRLLVSYRRLNYLPQITALFEQSLAAYHQTCTVQVDSAYPLSTTEKEKLSQALQKRLNCQVNLNCYIDEKLLGGAVVTIGDEVIDGSIRGRLNRLGEQLREANYE